MNETEERWRRDDRARVTGGALGFVPSIALFTMFPPPGSGPACHTLVWSLAMSLVGVTFVFAGVFVAHAVTLRR